MKDNLHIKPLVQKKDINLSRSTYQSFLNLLFHLPFLTRQAGKEISINGVDNPILKEDNGPLKIRGRREMALVYYCHHTDCSHAVIKILNLPMIELTTEQMLSRSVLCPICDRFSTVTTEIVYDKMTEDEMIEAILRDLTPG